MIPANRPAFPGIDAQGYKESGLTKREIFAMAAMQGIIGRPNLADDGEEWLNSHKTLADAVAHQAVTLADALLAELEKPNAP